MLKCRISKAKSSIWVKATGTGDELTTETLMLIAEVFRGLSKQNPPVGRAFKLALIGTLIDPKSPVWEEAAPNG